MKLNLVGKTLHYTKKRSWVRIMKRRSGEHYFFLLNEENTIIPLYKKDVFSMTLNYLGFLNMYLNP